ncbi:ribokinase [Microbacterium mcarthurae (nom. nud.)]|uniref:Ribokinase n=1 Tax=Microbacterium mcarthurae TaxID=3035918 RepID=A0ABW9GFQ6_9MICO
MNAGRGDSPVEVAVVGSVNLDIVISCDRRPGPGETVAGRTVDEVIGGKGANQAIAAASAARCALIAAVGNDAAAQAARTALEQAGVMLDALDVSALPTGRAYITVTPDGENSIVVVPMANADLTADRVFASLERKRPRVVLSQLEVPLEAVYRAADWCESNGARFLLNPSPMIAFDRRLLAMADPLVVNRHEAELLCGPRGADVAGLARELSALCRSVVDTHGAQGAYVAVDGAFDLVPAPAVTVVDTTGAGDAFAGAIAARLARGDSVRHATEHAVATASRIVQLARSDR